ncbi:hypothetical protein Micbo1qcDRAFT_7032 [Microdochium bolleyi]|uniref:EthD domain-containing protein n=1 Tax=Microdochium bolleyi TaxID=196109 RepID=A0A136JJK4_9PEZI|nr:hypothetical protein Micbo1qcDRAFT_7032 [Microdochium bolleyi]
MPDVDFDDARLQGMKGPGLLWVASKIKKPDLLDWTTFLKWYDEEVFPQAIDMSMVPSGLRSTARDQSNEWWNLCLSPVTDFAYFQTDEFQQAMADDNKNKLLPAGGKYHDLVDFDCRFYNIQSTFEHGNQTTLESTKCLMVSQWDFRADMEESEFDGWYYSQHLPMMGGVPGFLRSSRYKLDHGLWTSGDGAELPCPDWVEVNEFDTMDIDVYYILEAAAKQSEQMHDIMAKTTFSIDVYRVEKLFGDKTFFHGFGRPSSEAE